MKIVNIIGGLGNQMFQYAFAEALKYHFPDEDVLIDTSHFKHIFIKKFKVANLHNGYEMDKVFPNADLPIATGRQLRKVSRYIPNYLISRLARKYLKPKPTEYIQEKKDSFAYNPDVFRKGDCYYEGIWESVQYLNPVREKLRLVYAHPQPNEKNAALIRQIEREDSVGIHIRRGDYLQFPDFRGICEVEYYKKAIENIASDGKKHSYYIFSNDIAWCEEYIRPLVGNQPITFVTHNTGKLSCWDMFLMTYCKDLIIANSSFSWWGAFLNNRGGRVVAPKKWKNREAEYDIWLPEWIRI